MRRRKDRERLRGASLLAAGLAGFLAWAHPEPARAMCNLIPLAIAEYRSTQGMVDRTIAHPGGPLSRASPAPPAVVTLRADLACTPTAPGFDPDPTRNRVTLRFELAGQEVAVDAAQVSLANCGPARCDTLSFRTPDTDALVAPAGDGVGLAGPATIFVRAPSGTKLAEIGPLFAPSRSCDDDEPEEVFEHFTVLPRLNDFGAVADGSTSRVVATLDGGDNLVIPFDYRTVLAAAPGDPIFRILAGSASIPAFLSDPGTPIRIPDTGFPFVRSFSIIGRPLPPILEATAAGDELFGTVDGSEGIVRVARFDAWANTPAIYDLRSRATAGRGSLVIGSAEQVELEVREVALLEGLEASPEVVSFPRDESVELADLNADGDREDLVAQLIDVATGGSTNTHEAVARSVSGEFRAPALVAGGDLAAFVGEGPGDLLSLARTTHLRVFASGGEERSGANPASVDASLRIDGRPLAIRDASPDASVPEPRVVFRQPAAYSGIVAPAGVAELEDLEASPDGRHLYAWMNTGGIRAYRVEPNGALSVAGRFALPGVEVPRDGIIAPDGRHVITLLPGNETAVSRRDPVTGSLSLVEAVTHPGLVGSFVGDGFGPGGAVMSPDARFLYVLTVSPAFVDPRDVGVATFRLDGASGQLSLLDEFFYLTGQSVLTAFGGALDVALSRDGRHLYAYTSARDCPEGPPCGRIATFAIDGASGLLSGGAGAADPRFATLYAVHVSADDRFLYASADRMNPPFPTSSPYLQSFRRDPATGALSLDWESRSAAVDHFFGTPDASHLYADTKGIAELLRPSLATGELVVERLYGRLAGLPSGTGPVLVSAVSPDGKHPYLFVEHGDTEDRIAVLHLEQRLGVFDPAARASRLDGSGAPGASRVVTAGSQALILTPESVDGADLNGNGVPGPSAGGEAFLDRVAQRVDLRDPAAPGAVTSLGVAGSEIALSEELAAVLVPEAQQLAATPPVGAGCPGGVRDLNGDCDERDLVLHVHAPGEPVPARPVGVTGTTIGVTGRRVVLLADEADEAGRVLNGDGDAADRVIRIYDDARPEPQPADRVRDLGLAAEDFVLGETLVAFRVPEAAQGGPVAAPGCRPAAGGGCDLNGDGDAADAVMHVYDLVSGELLDTERAATLCNFPGCGPFLEPYRIRERVDAAGNRIRTLAFLTRESEQGSPDGGAGPGCLPQALPVCDLDGDGEGGHLVVQVFSLNSRSYQVIPTAEDPDGDPGTPPFPDTLIDQSVLHVQLPESALGADVNEDGVVDDTLLVFIAGDSDEDGTLDAATVGVDTCVETPNPEQLDADADLLGDRVCDPDPTSVPPGEAGVPCDLDGNGFVTGADLEILAGDAPMEARESDPRDPDGDGQVSESDVALCRERCRTPACEGNVAIDVRPGDAKNPVNPRSEGVIPVAILGSSVRDVTQVDVATLRFGPAGAPTAHKKCGHLEDVNGDGTIDLVTHHRVEETGIAPGHREACLVGRTRSGEALAGCDRVTVLGACGLGYELALVLPLLASLRRRLRTRAGVHRGRAARGRR